MSELLFDSFCLTEGGGSFCPFLSGKHNFDFSDLNDGPKVSCHCFARSPGQAHADSDGPSDGPRLFLGEYVKLHTPPCGILIHHFQTGNTGWLQNCSKHLSHYLTLKHWPALWGHCRVRQPPWASAGEADLTFLLHFQANVQECVRVSAHWFLHWSVVRCSRKISEESGVSRAKGLKTSRGQVQKGFLHLVEPSLLWMGHPQLFAHPWGFESPRKRHHCLGRHCTLCHFM